MTTITGTNFSRFTNYTDFHHHFFRLFSSAPSSPFSPFFDCTHQVIEFHKTSHYGEAIFNFGHFSPSSGPDDQRDDDVSDSCLLQGPKSKRANSKMTPQSSDAKWNYLAWIYRYVFLSFTLGFVAANRLQPAPATNLAECCASETGALQKPQEKKGLRRMERKTGEETASGGARRNMFCWSFKKEFIFIARWGFAVLEFFCWKVVEVREERRGGSIYHNLEINLPVYLTKECAFSRLSCQIGQMMLVSNIHFIRCDWNLSTDRFIWWKWGVKCL